ncbi:MAG: hypothetical protein HQ525_03830 [Anaerolineae bacterium]|nr:hypothetical protein [Anaerolineae bacterium]
MQRKPSLFVIMILLLALTAACGDKTTTTAEVAPPAQATLSAPEVSAKEPPISTGAEFDFPLPKDVDEGSVMDLGNGSINFQTTLSLSDAITFYRFAFTELGYVEREILTSFEDTGFSVVFDGHPSGEAIVVQGVDLGESVNINLRFEDT